MNAYENTDKEIWRKIEGDYYSPRIFVTKEGNVGISVGGNVYVQSVEEWHKQADRIAELEKEIEECWCGGHSYAYLRAKNRLPQTKPLSDEEIMDIAEQSDYSPLEIEMGYDYEIRIARAIEEKHGIK